MYIIYKSYIYICQRSESCPYTYHTASTLRMCPAAAEQRPAADRVLQILSRPLEPSASAHLACLVCPTLL